MTCAPRALAAASPVLEAGDLPARLCRRDLGSDAPRAGTLAEAVVAQVEREMILKRLAQFQGNRTAAAESLRISRKTLLNKMRQSGMDALEADG